MIDVVRDRKGVRMALEHLFEEDHARAKIERIAGSASEEQKSRLQHLVPSRKLSPGYYAWAQHLLGLDEERRAGVALLPASMASFEVAGLVDLEEARNAYRYRHPPCQLCGVHQDTRFAPECCGCAVKFRRKRS